MNSHVLELNNYSVSFYTPRGEIEAVRNVDLTVDRGEILCIVGESGCGKTVMCQSLLRLLPGFARVRSGRAILEGRDISTCTEKEMRSIRGNLISMVFQDPMMTLNPTIPVGKQITEAILKHSKMSRNEAKARAIELLKLVEIDNAEECFGLQPHFFSGGMRQRCVLAIALAMSPKLLIADEPTTALDATVETKILDLLLKLRDETGISIIFITHDLGAAARIADKVAVMYAGKVVETGTAEDIYYDPRHPYTWGLLASQPALAGYGGELYSIPGTPPSLLDPPKGDAFAVRNRYALAIDYEKQPPMFKVSDTHDAATWLLDKRAPGVCPPVHIEPGSGQWKRMAYGQERGTACKDNAADDAEYDAAADRGAAKGQASVIEVRELKLHFHISRNCTVKAVDDVSFDIKQGEILGLVGESGCGKSTLARTLSGIYRPTAGELIFEGLNVTEKLNSRRMSGCISAKMFERISAGRSGRISDRVQARISAEAAKCMHRDIQMIFQDSAAALNSHMTVRDILLEPVIIQRKRHLLQRHGCSSPKGRLSMDMHRTEMVQHAAVRLSNAQHAAVQPSNTQHAVVQLSNAQPAALQPANAQSEAEISLFAKVDGSIHGLLSEKSWRVLAEARMHELLNSVGLDESFLCRRPDELSGGQRQRVAIARCLMTDPKLIIADEPIASMDISMQAQIVMLLRRLQKERGFAMLFIAHDLSMVRFISDRTAVMLNGRIVELAPTKELFADPLHPYTKALLSSMHVPDPVYEHSRQIIEYDSSMPVSGRLVEKTTGHFVLL